MYNLTLDRGIHSYINDFQSFYLLQNEAGRPYILSGFSQCYIWEVHQIKVIEYHEIADMIA